MKLKILSFEWEAYVSETVVSVTMLTWAWEITVLDNHSPLITHVLPSTLYIIYKDENNIEMRNDFAIWRWIVEIGDWKVKIMTDMLTDIADLDIDNIERAKAEAMKFMEKYKWSENQMDMAKFIEAEEALMKSIAQLKLYDLKK